MCMHVCICVFLFNYVCVKLDVYIYCIGTLSVCGEHYELQKEMPTAEMLRREGGGRSYSDNNDNGAASRERQVMRNIA